MPPMTPASTLESRHRSRSSGSSAAKVAKPSIDRMWAARRIGPRSLTVLELRFSFFEKRGHAFLLVLERELRVEHAALEQHALGERRLVGSVDRFLDHHHHRGRVAGDFL